MRCWLKPWLSPWCGTMSGVTSIPSIEDRTMLSGAMEHFGLSKSFTQAEGFETEVFMY